MPYSDLLKGRCSLQGLFYHISTVTAGKLPHFRDFQLCRVVIRELKTCDDENLCLTYAWALMPDHLHWIFQLTGSKPLSEVVRLFKGRSARRMNQSLKSRGAIWKAGYYEHLIRHAEDLRGSAENVINNPVRRETVKEIGDYPFWDASWLQKD